MTTVEVSERSGFPYFYVSTPSVQSIEQANAVVDILEQRLSKCPVEYGNLIFQHAVIIDDIKSNGLPLPNWNSLAIEPTASEVEQQQLLNAFQPGWFWLHVGLLDAGWDVVERWVSIIENISQKNTDTWGNKPGIWEDEGGVALGESAVLCLAMRDKKWLPLYSRLMNVWDLGHEVHTRSSINALFNKYGLIAPMADLLVQRVSVDGQHGPRQVFGTLRDDIRRMLPENQFDAFYDRALSAFRDSTKAWMDWPPDERNLEKFAITDDLREIAKRLGAT